MTVLDRITRRISPFHKLMTARDYNAVKSKQRFEGGTTRLLNSPINFSSAEGLLHSMQEIFCQEVYRFNTEKQAPRIIDVGANIGLSVLYFKRCYPGSTIIAYEPDPAIFRLLKSNVGHLPGVELREAAAWIEDTTLTFYSEGSLAGSLEIDFEKKNNVKSVRAQRLRDEVAKAPVDFLKIDVEGAENNLLFDIESELPRVERLFFEYHSNPDKPQLLGDLLNLVARNGYRYAINGPHGPEHPFTEKVSHGFDLQLNIFCFRETDSPPRS